jgi:hypothetical protein
MITMYYYKYSDRIKSFFVIILPFIGFFLITSTVIFILYWETIGREKYLYEDIIVLNENVECGEVISLENLKEIKIEKDKIVSGIVKEKMEIVNFTAKHFIPAKIQLHPSFFKSPDILIDEDKFIFELLSNNIYSIPDSIRRKDKIYIVPYNTGRNEVGKKPLLETTAVYVKDSSNREVVDVGEGERENGSSKVSNIEIIVDSEEFQILMENIAAGNKFVIIYRNTREEKNEY